MSSADLQAAWRSLVKIFPACTVPIDVLVSPASWRFVGTDLLKGPFGDRKSQAVAAILGKLPEEMGANLSAMADINVRRAAGAFTTVAVAYVSLPLGVGALVSEVAPDDVRAYVEANMSNFIVWVATLSMAPVVYFFGMWRARQLHWTIELVRLGAIVEAPAAIKRSAQPADAATI